MKKEYFCLIIAVVLSAVCLLAGCGGRGADSGNLASRAETTTGAATSSETTTAVTRRSVSFVGEQQIGDCNLLVLTAQINTRNGEDSVVLATVTLYEAEISGGGVTTRYSSEMSAEIENSNPGEFLATFADGTISGAIEEDSFTGVATVDGEEVEINAKPLEDTPWRLIK